MFRKFKAAQRDYPAILAVAVLLFATFILGGITYTYARRPSALTDAASHLFDRRQLPAAVGWP